MEQEQKRTPEQHLEMLQRLLVATYTCEATNNTTEEVIDKNAFMKEYGLTKDELKANIQKVENLHEATLIFLRNYVNNLYNIKIQVNPQYETNKRL